MAAPTLTVRDDRTGAEYVIPIEDGAIHAHHLAQIKERPDDDGLISYDPGLRHTAICRSSIGQVDGAAGTLLYRGYPIDELAAHSSYLETAYLIVKGHLPTASHFATWERNIKQHTLVHESVKRLMEGFRYDAPPMGVLVGMIGSLSAFYPDARDVLDLESRRVQTRRLIGKIPTIAAFAYRRRRGLPYVYPNSDLSYAGNFLSMLFKMTELEFRPDPVLERALDVLFILYAEHAQNCSTAGARLTGSAHADAYAVVAAAAAAMSGPGHGGASELVLHMLRQIGTPERVPAFLAEARTTGKRLPGVGHSIYRSRDPRAILLRPIAEQVFGVLAPPAELPVAREVERLLADDAWFVEHGWFPTVDFYAALVYSAMKIPVEMFPVLFAIPRTASWMAQWAETVLDPDQIVARPRQIYTGHPRRAYLPLDERSDEGMLETEILGSL